MLYIHYTYILISKYSLQIYSIYYATMIYWYWSTYVFVACAYVTLWSFSCVAVMINFPYWDQ